MKISIGLFNKIIMFCMFLFLVFLLLVISCISISHIIYLDDNLDRFIISIFSILGILFYSACFIHVLDKMYKEIKKIYKEYKSKNV